tara:strand:+ start:156 stop:878 length:723 start_codon:yes stop_codon:yes gene_type:complete
MTTVNIGSGVTSVANCPKTVTVGLAGQTTSTWASDAIILLSPALKTDSDGYQFTILVDGNITALTTSFLFGGCVVTTGNYVCINAQLDVASTPTGIDSLNNRWILKKDWLATAYPAGTAITAAKWQMVFTGTAAACVPLVAAQTGAVATSCLVATYPITAGSGTATFGMNYYQPKETSDKVYTGLPRFAKGESMKYIGLVSAAAATAFPSVACGTAKALLGASSLIAGAAVAFGAATLAF